MPLVRVCSVDDLKNGEGKVMDVNGEAIALFKIDGKFYAINNTCLHRGGPLGEGFLEGDIVTCPWHGWKYNVATGVNPAMPSMKVQTYSVTVQGNDIMVEV